MTCSTRAAPRERINSSSRSAKQGIEAESLHVGAHQIGAEAGPLQTALEVALLCDVIQACQSDVKALRAELTEEAADVGRAAH